MSNTITLSYPSVSTRADHAERLQEITLDFHPITVADMPLIWQYLSAEPGRTTDFSYGGLLMWVDKFHYEMALAADTLFIKGRMEDDLRKLAFSLPLGSLPLKRSVQILKKYCRARQIPLRFSAVPEYALSSLMTLSPARISLLDDWGDYLYDVEKLATLSGKKMAKKRNHVNQYLAQYGSETFRQITGADFPAIEAFMQELDSLDSVSGDAAEERILTRNLLSIMAREPGELRGGLLEQAGKVVAFTIGDVKGDTLFIHVEKALRTIAGAYEMINKSFAEYMLACHPDLRYINREDDGGDPGLRRAKESYHPLEILKKYNVVF